MNRFHDADSVEALIYQIVGAGSTCWENLRAAGVFDDVLAREVAEAGIERLDELDDRVDPYELTEALRLTVEYVGTDKLYPIEGWSWYDAMLKYRPDVAEAMLRFHEEHVVPAMRRPQSATPGAYCYPPVDPVTGEVSAADDAILMGEMRHCDVPDPHRRSDCTHLMRHHGWLDIGGAGITLCPRPI